MDFSIKQIENKQIWDNFIQAQPEYAFLHSWSWGEFNLLMGNNAWRLGLYESDELLSVALVVGIDARRGKFLFVPHGPVVKYPITNDQYPNILGALIKYLKELAYKKGYDFIRIGPLVERNEESEKLFSELGFRKAPMHMHMESTLILDITKSEDELMKNMRKTTRYLIRQAEKKGVVIEIETPLMGKDFLRLQGEVVDRKHFIAFSEKQIESEIKSLGEGGELVIFNAKYNNEVIASALIIFYGYRAVYYQAASANEYRDLSAPYLLVWKAILAAKERGCMAFDFYGASPEDKPNHPWAGPTLFKKGFGGYRVDYLEARDLILNWRYWIAWGIESVRRIKRGF